MLAAWPCLNVRIVTDARRSSFDNEENSDDDVYVVPVPKKTKLPPVKVDNDDVMEVDPPKENVKQAVCRQRHACVAQGVWESGRKRLKKGRSQKPNSRSMATAAARKPRDDRGPPGR